MLNMNLKKFYLINNIFFIVLTLWVLSTIFFESVRIPLYLGYGVLPLWFISSLFFNKWANNWSKIQKYQYLIQKQENEKNKIR